jgi:deoxyribodipyrimidine photo-lyase
MPRTTLVWFREDLRLHDNPALDHAAQTAERVIPVYLHTPGEAGEWAPGGASRWWLHHSLRALDKDLQQAGSGLVLRQGDSALALLQALLRETGADSVAWNRLYTPWAIARDRQIRAALTQQGIAVHSFRASLLFEPQSVVKDNGEPYRVFTAFWKRCQAQPLYQSPCATPERIRSDALARGSALEQLGLLPCIPWDRGFYPQWTPGEAGAHAQAEAFFADDVEEYDTARDIPGVSGTSRLSAHLHFGEISPRVLMNRAVQALDEVATPAARQSVTRFMAELGWREFAAHILYHFPDSAVTSMDARFAQFPWAEPEAEVLQRWQQGRTGFPVIDAGLRELWHTGWMHNRVRMLVASFLVKNLRLHWLHGARWFWDTLVDADLASNSLGWQWVAGCGTDAAPYFRIFNPVLQGSKFDRNGEYVRRWVPELEHLDRRYIHEPWQAPVRPDYPAPLLDLGETREQALAAFRSLRGR